MAKTMVCSGFKPFLAETVAVAHVNVPYYERKLTLVSIKINVA